MPVPFNKTGLANPSIPTLVRRFVYFRDRNMLGAICTFPMTTQFDSLVGLMMAFPSEQTAIDHFGPSARAMGRFALTAT
jgi:hypothetical protein